MFQALFVESYINILNSTNKAEFFHVSFFRKAIKDGNYHEQLLIMEIPTMVGYLSNYLPEAVLEENSNSSDCSRANSFIIMSAAS